MSDDNTQNSQVNFESLYLQAQQEIANLQHQIRLLALNYHCAINDIRIYIFKLNIYIFYILETNQLSNIDIEYI